MKARECSVTPFPAFFLAFTSSYLNFLWPGSGSAPDTSPLVTPVPTQRPAAALQRSDAPEQGVTERGAFLHATRRLPNAAQSCSPHLKLFLSPRTLDIQRRKKRAQDAQIGQFACLSFGPRRARLSKPRKVTAKEARLGPLSTYLHPPPDPSYSHPSDPNGKIEALVHRRAPSERTKTWRRNRRC